MAKYQIYNGLVTSINPSTLLVGKGTQRETIAIDVPIIDSDKHKKIIGYVISVGVNTHENNPKGLQWQGYIDRNNPQLSINQSVSSGVPAIGTFEYIGYPNSFSKQYPTTNVFNRINIWLYLVDNYPLNVSNFSCLHVWGNVAIPIIISNISNSFIDYRKDFNVSFSTKNDSTIFEQFTIDSGVFKYREKGTTSTYAQISFTGNQAMIPSNTFTNGKVYECYATCTVDDNQVADSPMIELTTIDTIPTLTTTKPKNEITYGEVFFDWNYDNQTGVEQYAFDLQYSTDNLTWVDLDVHTVSNITQATHIVPAGDLFWRVRGYNQNDVASEWSASAKFINVAKPTKPAITETIQSGMPTIKWSSENQIAFEIEIDGLWKSRQIYTTNKFYKFEEYLPNGNYRMRLRIYNQYAQFSDWLEFDYSQNMNVNQPQATITETQKGFNIKIKNDLSIMTYYLLRNGIPIHKFIDLEYEDIYVNGDTLYTIRAVDFQGNFADLTLPVKRDKKEVVLIDLQGNIYNLGTNIGDWTKIEKSTIKDRQDVSYLGRSKPIIINGDLEYSQWSIGAVFKDLPLGEILFYRDFSGTGSWVMAHNIGSTINKYYIQSSTVLREVSYEERIEY